MLAGKNADDTEMSPKEKAQQVAAAGFPEGGGAIDPSVMGSPKPSDGSKPKDPIDRLYRWLFNKPDYSEGPANKPMLDWSLRSVAGLKFPPLDTSKFGAEPADETGLLKQFRLPPPITVDDLIGGVIAQQRQTAMNFAPLGFNLDGSPIYGAASNAKMVNSNNTTTTNVEVHVDVHAAEPDPDGEKLGEAVGRHVDDKIKNILQTARSTQKEIE